MPISTFLKAFTAAGVLTLLALQPRTLWADAEEWFIVILDEPTCDSIDPGACGGGSSPGCGEDDPIGSEDDPAARRALQAVAV